MALFPPFSDAAVNAQRATCWVTELGNLSSWPCTSRDRHHRHGVTVRPLNHVAGIPYLTSRRLIAAPSVRPSTRQREIQKAIQQRQVRPEARPCSPPNPHWWTVWVTLKSLTWEKSWASGCVRRQFLNSRVLDSPAPTGPSRPGFQAWLPGLASRPGS